MKKYKNFNINLLPVILVLVAIASFSPYFLADTKLGSLSVGHYDGAEKAITIIIKENEITINNESIRRPLELSQAAQDIATKLNKHKGKVFSITANENEPYKNIAKIIAIASEYGKVHY